MKANHYVDNKLLTRTLSRYIEERKEDDTLTLKQFDGGEYIGKCIIDICNNLAHKTNFIGYTFKDEMIEDGIENCVKAAKNFDPELSNNAFGYFTQVSFHAFVRRIKKEAKHREKFLRILSDSDSLNEIIDSQFDGNDSSIDAQHFVDNIHSLLVENEQLLEINQPQIRRRKQKVSSIFDEFL